MRRIAVILASIATLTSGVAAAASAEAPEAKLTRALEGRVAGTPVHCLSLRDIRSTRIIDGTAILYEAAGGKIYVNKPVSGASSLRWSTVMVTKTPSSQLCNVDIVRLYDSGSRIQSGSVALGDFVPYVKIES